MEEFESSLNRESQARLKEKELNAIRCLAAIFAGKAAGQVDFREFNTVESMQDYLVGTGRNRMNNDQIKMVTAIVNTRFYQKKPFGIYEAIEPRGEKFMSYYLDRLQDRILEIKYGTKRILAFNSRKRMMGKNYKNPEFEELHHHHDTTMESIYGGHLDSDFYNAIEQDTNEINRLKSESDILEWADREGIFLENEDLGYAKDLAELDITHIK